MIRMRAYKTELNPNNKQKNFLRGCFGEARFVYNWGLETKIKQYQETGKSDDWMDLGKKLVVLKKNELSWMYKYPNWVHVYALKHLDQAYKNFFRRVKNGEKPGFPKFKARKEGFGVFTVNGSAIEVRDGAVKLPKVGWIRLKEHGYIPVSGEYINATVSEDHGRYFISANQSIDMVEQLAPTTAIGIDVGIKTLVVTSEGRYYDNPKNIYKAEKKLHRLQRLVSGRQKGSKNRKKAVLKLARLYKNIANKRSDTIHKLTTELARTKSVLAIENLNVVGMTKNHRLARAVNDASFYEIRRQLEYKAVWYGSEVYVVDRFFPSSKTCSNCGEIHSDLTLSDRVFECKCGLKIDRDLNAAINLRTYAEVRRNLRPWRECKTDSSSVGSLDEVGSEHKTSISLAILHLEDIQNNGTDY